MRKSLLFIVMLGSVLLAQTITPIHDIQYTTDPSGDSPLKDQVVTISGTVTVGRYAFSSGYFFMQDAPGAWNGIQVYVGSSSSYVVMEGDSVQVTGKVDEYYNLTELVDVTELIKLDSCKWIEPVEGTTAGIDSAEQFESVLVKVKNVTVTNETDGSYAWLVDDGSGECKIGTRADDNYFYKQKVGDVIDWIVGVAFLSSGHNEIQPRAAYDFGAINGSTMIQSIQQVRECDVIAGNDSSLFTGDTLTITGIVTVQSGLMYAGDGKKYYVQQSGGGIWSGILVFDYFSEEVATVFEGDSISVTGYVSEYWSNTYPGNTTEFFATEEIELLGMYCDLPEPVVVNTSVFNDSLYYDGIPGYEPEKYENVLMEVVNVMVDSVNAYGDPLVVDASGRGLWVNFGYSDSVSLGAPAVGTMFESITGVLYHHWGVYELLPRYDRDIVVMVGPPIISGTRYYPVNPQPEDTITVSTSVLDDGTITEATLYYSVNSGTFTPRTLTKTSGYAYEAKIDPLDNGDTVRFFIHATDNDNNESLDPATAPDSLYSFVVFGPTETTIYDIQFTEDASGDSPLKGKLVKFTGTVTSDSSTYTKSFHVQDFSNSSHPAAAWNGIMIYSDKYPNLTIGNNVEVVGTVQEYYGLTEIGNVASITKLSGTTDVIAAEVSSADIPCDSTISEKYEGVLVKIPFITVLSAKNANGDWTVTDDQGFVVQINGYKSSCNYDYEPVVGDQIEFITGNLTYSYNYYEIIVRDNNDIGTVVGIDNDRLDLPVSYRLDQNYPNPFNPTTTINYGIEKSGNVTLKVYNIIGQEIVTLVHKNQHAGNYTLTWNGLDRHNRIVPAGVYIYQIVAGDFVQSKKMILLK